MLGFEEKLGEELTLGETGSCGHPCFLCLQKVTRCITCPLQMYLRSREVRVFGRTVSFPLHCMTLRSSSEKSDDSSFFDVLEKRTVDPLSWMQTSSDVLFFDKGGKLLCFPSSDGGLTKAEVECTNLAEYPCGLAIDSGKEKLCEKHLRLGGGMEGLTASPLRMLS